MYGVINLGTGFLKKHVVQPYIEFKSEGPNDLTKIDVKLYILMATFEESFVKPFWTENEKLGKALNAFHFVGHQPKIFRSNPIPQQFVACRHVHPWQCTTQPCTMVLRPHHNHKCY